MDERLSSSHLLLRTCCKGPIARQPICVYQLSGSQLDLRREKPATTAVNLMPLTPTSRSNNPGLSLVLVQVCLENGLWAGAVVTHGGCPSFPSESLSLEESEEKRKSLLYAQPRSHLSWEHKAFCNSRKQVTSVNQVWKSDSQPHTPASEESLGVWGQVPGSAALSCPPELTTCCRET